MPCPHCSLARLTKKSLIRSYLEREHPAIVGPAEAAAIRRELAAALGPRGRLSDRYLLDVLEECGARVDKALGGLDPELLALLDLDTLAAAEQALAALEERRGRALEAGDAAAADECRRAGRRARERAELVVRNPRVRPAVRAQKEEIARWFAVWLQTPEAFPDWLELRKKSPEFRQRFAL